MDLIISFTVGLVAYFLYYFIKFISFSYCWYIRVVNKFSSAPEEKSGCGVPLQLGLRLKVRWVWRSKENFLKLPTNTYEKPKLSTLNWMVAAPPPNPQRGIGAKFPPLGVRGFS